ncbi:retrovirus-related Pol polyprotein from transposon 412 [Trichonephila clavipes]|nr:retrovirus-related Pol polyprotein from transposon 412 [Trichonephila clavipes]
MRKRESPKNAGLNGGVGVELHPDDKEKAAFTTEQGIWQFKVMPFGLCNAPETFERLMETVLGGLSYEAFLVYLDDIIIVGRSFEEHMKISGQVSVQTRKKLLCDQEGTARYIVKAVEHFHPYLYGQRFLLRTDHTSLTWLLNFKNSEGQIARWIQRLQEYDVEIRPRKGSAHGNADTLSRRPCPESCKYCSRIEKKFGIIGPIVRQVTTPSTSALDPWSDESVRKDQMADSEIKPIIEFKESSDEMPSLKDIAPFHPTTKRYWALWDSLHLRNAVLYRKWESDDGKTFSWQLILPKTRVSTVLKELRM